MQNDSPHSFLKFYVYVAIFTFLSYLLAKLESDFLSFQFWFFGAIFYFLFLIISILSPVTLIISMYALLTNKAQKYEYCYTTIFVSIAFIFFTLAIGLN